MSKNIETKTTPAYVILCAAIAAELEVAGVELKDQGTEVDGVPGNANWACFERKDSGQKLYVSRAVGKPIIHTTIEVHPSTPGYIDHKGKNPGKIASFFKADLDLVIQHLIPLFVAAKEPLRASKPAVRKVKNADGSPIVETESEESGVQSYQQA